MYYFLPFWKNSIIILKKCLSAYAGKTTASPSEAMLEYSCFLELVLTWNISWHYMPRVTCTLRQIYKDKFINVSITDLTYEVQS